MKILNYSKLDLRQTYQFNKLLRMTVKRHCDEWQKDDVGKHVNNIVTALLITNKIGMNRLLAMIDENNDVVSILHCGYEHLDNGPYKGRIVRNLLWCCTNTKFRNKGLTKKFHDFVVGELVKTGIKYLSVTVDDSNDGAKKLAFFLTKKYSGIVRTEVHSLEDMKVRIYLHDGNDFIKEWEQDHL